MHLQRSSLFFLPTLGLAVGMAFMSCGKQGSDATAGHKLPDTLRVVTLYSPTSYFIYRDEPMGYDYTLVDSLARQKGMVLDLKVASSLSAAVSMLDSGKVDLIAYDVPITEHYLKYVIPCGPENYTTQVLVQPKVQGKAPITDVTELVGKEVYVEKDSKYLRRLQNLNDELGGGIEIREVDADSLITEDLITMVNDGKIPMTVVDSDIAKLNRTYYPGLDIDVPVSFAQRHRGPSLPARSGWPTPSTHGLHRHRRKRPTKSSSNNFSNNRNTVLPCALIFQRAIYRNTTTSSANMPPP